MRFVKKPVEVEAIQLVDGTSGMEIVEWMRRENFLTNFEELEVIQEYGEITEIIIHTLEGSMRADLYDWVIRGVKGEFYPCKPDIFEETYEEVKA